MEGNELIKRLDLPVAQSEVGGDIFQIAERKLDKMMELAKMLVDTGFMPQAVKTPGQALAIILAGREMGIPMMQALRQIQVVQGRTTISSELMLAQVYTKIAGFKHEIVERTDTCAKVKFERPGANPYIHEFTMADAERLGLKGKDNYIKQPKTMLLWRCISGGLRVYVPFAVNGMYLPEEIDPDNTVVDPDGVMTLDPPSTSTTAPKKKTSEKKPIDVKPEPESKPEPKPEPKQETKPEPVAQVAALPEETRMKIIGAFGTFGLNQAELEKITGKPATEWTDTERTWLLGNFKTIRDTDADARDEAIMTFTGKRM